MVPGDCRAPGPIASQSWPNIVPANVTVWSFVSASGPVAAAPPRSRSLFFIGDSVTAGNQIDPDSCVDDNWGTYGAKLGRRFDADCATAAISGAGIFVNAGFLFGNVTMAAMWNRVFPYAASSASPPPPPDAVHINLGTNDAGEYNGTAAWVSGFAAAYEQLILDITTLYGADLPVFCGVGPITHAYYPWVLLAVEQAVATGRAVVCRV